MREDVNKSAIRVDQIKMVVKKQEPTETPTENWDLNVDGLIDTSSKPANTCPRCLRKFSRDSTYISHMSSCGASVTIRRNAKNAQKVEIKPIVAELPPPKIKRNIPDIAERMATKRKLRSSTNARMVEIQDENDKENKNLKIKEELEPPVKKRRYTKKAKVVKESAGVKSPTKRLRPKTK